MIVRIDASASVPTARHDEAGIAMIVAIMVVMLLTLIPLAIFTQAVQQLPLARHDQDHESALAAAEAGVDDYLNRLARTATTGPTARPTRRPDGNGAFTGWVQVAGPSTQRRVASGTRPTSTQDRVDRHRLPHVVRQASTQRSDAVDA